MNTRILFPLVSAALVYVSPAGFAEAGKTSQADKGAANVSKTESTAVARVEIPKSVFEIPSSPAEGRDPFYPDSTRLFASQPKTGGDKNAKTQGSPVVLSLKAISASGNRRVATINNRPFETGEEAELAFGATRLRIRCLEIKEDSVMVEVDGRSQELRLRPGL